MKKTLFRAVMAAAMMAAAFASAAPPTAAVDPPALPVATSLQEPSHQAAIDAAAERHQLAAAARYCINAPAEPGMLLTHWRAPIAPGLGIKVAAADTYKPTHGGYPSMSPRPDNDRQRQLRVVRWRSDPLGPYTRPT